MIHFEIKTNYGLIYIDYLGKKIIPNQQQEDWNTFIQDTFNVRKKIPKDQIFSINQVHGDLALHTSDLKLNKNYFPQADALISSEEDEILVIRTADCVPISIWCYEIPIIANIHSGWKGTKHGILENTLSKLREFASRKQILNPKFGFAIGPRIAGQDYEIGDDVAKFFQGQNGLSRKGKANQVDDGSNGEKYLLDLCENIKARIQEIAGNSFILDVSDSTYGSDDWFSHRFGDLGRNLNSISIRMN